MLTTKVPNIREMGWCNGCVKRTGKRNFAKLINGLCCECSLDTLETDKNKISKIIEEINAADRHHSRIIREGLMAIEDLGGYRKLGFGSDAEFLKAKFPRFSSSYLVKQRSCGRIERILEVPIGHYGIEAIYQLIQFRIMIPIGAVERDKSGRILQSNSSLKPNPKGIDKLKQAWELACKLNDSTSQFPEPRHIRKAMQILCSEGKAKLTKHRGKAENQLFQIEAENLQLKKLVEELEAKCNQLQSELELITQELQSLKSQQSE